MTNQTAMPTHSKTAEEYLRERYGAYRAHHAWRELEEAFNAGKAAQQPIKDHMIAQAVNALRDITIRFHATQQLRERIAHIAVPLAKGDAQELERELNIYAAQQAQQPAQDMSTQYTYQENMYKKCEKLNTFDAQAPEERDKATCKVDYLRANFAPFYLLANARRIASAEYKRNPNWVLAMNLFAVGSNSAIAICRDSGIDPDAIEVRRALKKGGGNV